MLLLPPSSTLAALKSEVATALNDTSDPPREVKSDDVSIYRQTDGRWKRLDEEDKGTKRSREPTLEDFEIRGIGSGSLIDGDGEVLAYTVRNGLPEEETVDIELYPRDD